MDEEDCDYRTPVGKVIKQMQYLCKKPLLDSQLSEAIDLFHEQLNDQEKYLANGIFRINFAESALFLQGCTELYGKKVDLLWKELLEFHTRLIRYDCEHRKEKGIPINKEVVSKLEERRNRHLRKKNFKLLQEEEKEVCVVKPSKNKICWDYIIDEDGKLLEMEEETFSSQPKEESKSIQKWNDVLSETKDYLKVPYFVYRQMRRTYRLKNYPILKSEDFDILDMEDGEFNTKYSRVPGWHHVFHLIEYNNQGLLPDSNSAIARLKFTMEVRLKFLASRRLYGTPHEQYKKELKRYRKQFLRDEAKRWQNMPLNTCEDFRRQLKLLTYIYRRKENLTRCSFKYIGQNGKDDKIEILDTSDEDSLYELSLAYDNQFMKSDLFVRLEKLSCDIVNTKLRLDSGYFGYNSGSDSENSETVEGEAENLDTNTLTSATDTNVNDADASLNVDVNRNYTDEINSGAAADKEDENNCDAGSVVSDHDYCGTPPVSDESAGCKSDPVKNDGALKTTEKIIKRPLGEAKGVPKIDKNETKRKHQINKEQQSGESPPKRRKLSQKQLEALLKSKITPVKLLKFEKFFSENYQSEEGEGEVPSIEYEDEDSYTQTADLDLPGDDNNCDEYEDVRSIHSDHSYCQPPAGNLPDDSGFVEPSLQSSLRDVNNRQTRDQFSKDVEEEYEKLVVALRENPDLTDFPELSLPSPYVPLQFGDKERNDLQARVQEWRNMINPILKNLKEKDFDIHEYGSQMIDGMEVNECKPFGNIVRGKTSAEVVRYFISSLQLANTNNIEICGAKRGELSNDTYNIKLLSKDRFHEHLGEYMAPSEETLAEKLERVRAMNAQQDSLDPPKTKRIKLTAKTCKAKRLPHITTKDKLVIKLSNIGHSRKEPSEATRGTCQDNKENRRTLTPVFLDNTAKGKAIIRRQAHVPQVLNFDSSVPSTSRHIHSLSPEFDGQMPSTSSQMFTPPQDSDSSEEDQRRSGGYVNSSNKRRRSEPTEETFLEQLVAAQKLNPEVQVHSTPHGATPPKHVRVSSCSKKTILF